MSLSNDLRAWRGKRAQKEVYNTFGVSLSTYQKWEEGKTIPTLMAENTIRWLMMPDSYKFIIKSVAAKIQKRK
jgi:DNA-binding transcriptional regulator YiaG